MERAEVIAALTELTKGLGVFRPNLVHDLDGRLKALRHCWSITITSDDEMSTKAARQLVIGNIRPLIEQLTPRPAHQSRRVDKRVDQYRTLVKACFNMPFSREEPEYAPLRRMRTLTGRRYWMQSEAPEEVRITVSVGQDDLKDAIDKMAELITSAGYRAVADVESGVPSSSADVQPDWVAEFNSQYARGRSNGSSPIHAAPVYVDGSWVVLTFIGEQDSSNLYFYRNSMVDLYRLGKILRLVVDIELERIDPGFTGIMLDQYSLSRGSGAVLRLVTTNLEIYRFFKRVGISRKFDWYPNVSLAISMPVVPNINDADGLTEVIEFSHEFRGSFVIVRIVGELDLLVADQLDAFLRNLLASGRVNFILDLEGVTWIDTSGVRPILIAQNAVGRQNGQLMVAVGSSSRVRSFFLLMGGFEPVFDTVEDALRAAGAADAQ